MLKPYKYKPSGKLTQTLAVVGVGRLVKPKKNMVIFRVKLLIYQGVNHGINHLSTGAELFLNHPLYSLYIYIYLWRCRFLGDFSSDKGIKPTEMGINSS